MYSISGVLAQVERPITAARLPVWGALYRRLPGRRQGAVLAYRALDDSTGLAARDRTSNVWAGHSQAAAVQVSVILCGKRAMANRCVEPTEGASAGHPGYCGIVAGQESSGRRTQFAEMLGGVALLAWLKRASRDEYTPEGVPALNEQDRAVLRKAYLLAADERLTDDDAVSELLVTARHHRKRLRKGEIAARRRGRYMDFVVENRAQRLHEAAATGQPVGAPTESDRHRFQVVESFHALARDQAWEQLVAAVPELATIADQQRAGLFDIPTSLADAAAPPEVQAAAARQSSAVFAELGVRLDRLLGPRSGQTDPLLGSVYVRQFAYEYLLQRQDPTGPATESAL